MFIEISAYQCTCERCDYQWSALKMPKTCAKCRSPYWNEPRGGISPTVTTLIEKTPEIKKNSAASPIVKKEYSFTELVEKRLHPERTDEERKQEIDSLKSLLDISNKKGNESVLPVYPPQVDEYGPVLNYD